MINFLGWIGSIAFAVCAAPQAYKSFKDGHSSGMSWGMLTLSLVGEVCSFAYVAPMRQYPLMLNYAANFLFCGIILLYKLKPRNIR